MWQIRLFAWLGLAVLTAGCASAHRRVIEAKDRSCECRRPWCASPLHNAARYCGSPQLAEALADGQTVDARDDRGQTALMLVAESGRAQHHWLYRSEEDFNAMLEMLFAAGADPNAHDLQGRTAMFFATTLGHGAAFEPLLEHGADIEARDNDGCTPLLYAAGQGCCVGQLIKAGADIEATDAFGRTPIVRAATLGSSRYAFDELLEAGADVSAAGWTPLIIASIRTDADEIERLLAAGVDAGTRDACGRTALMWAARFGYLEGQPCIDRLVAAGSPLDVRDAEGATAVLIAARHGSSTQLLRLLAAGADPNLADRTGVTPLIAAASLRTGSQFLVQRLLTFNANVDDQDAKGRNALMEAAEETYGGDSLMLLLSAGANPNLTDENGRDALILAVLNNGSSSMYEALLQAGANPLQTDAFGKSAIDYARESDMNWKVNWAHGAGTRWKRNSASAR